MQSTLAIRRMNVLKFLVILLFAAGHDAKNLELRNLLYGKHLKASMGHVSVENVPSAQYIIQILKRI